MKNIEWIVSVIVITAVSGCVLILPPPPGPPPALHAEAMPVAPPGPPGVPEHCGRPYGEPRQPPRDLGACR